MRLSGFLPVVGRRVMVALGVAVMMMVAASAQAQTAPAAAAAQAPAAAPCQAQPPDPLRFDGTHPAIVLLQIREKAEAGFVESIGKLKDMLAASSNPKAQEMGKGLTIYKLNVPANQDPTHGPIFVYVLHMETPVAGQSYNPLCVFYYSGYFLPLNEKGEPGGTPEERKKVDDVYQPMVAAVANLVPWPLTVIKK